MAGMEDSDQPNVDFYKNEKEYEPEGDYIDNVLAWKGDYKKLDKECAYIQWLFPNMVAGRNPAAYALTGTEAEIFRENPELKERLLKAFEMMLDFFGMELVDGDQFQLAANSDERLKEINTWGSSSFLHISRILLALKELGHDQLMLPWMKFLAELIYVDKKLDKAETSFEEFWMETLHQHDYVEIASIIEEYK